MDDNSGKDSRRLTGVFSRQVAIRIGEGTTQRKATQLVQYYAEEREDGSIVLQPLNVNYLPSGQPEIVDRETLARDYAPDVETFMKKTIPAMRELSKRLAKGERLRKRNEPYSAEMEFQQALKLDEDNVRGNFGLGLILLDRGDTDKAGDVFNKLMSLDETFHSKNKHLFNEFGVNLRRSGMIDQALKYFSNAFLLARNDENLLYNIARVFYDRGDFRRAAASLAKALELRPDFPQAKEFAAVLEKRQNVRTGGRPEEPLDDPPDLDDLFEEE